MSLFGEKKAKVRFGVIIDIGSGSVLTAIVRSDPKKKHPSIIWSHREHVPLRDVDTLEQCAKSVMTALVNSSMLLDSEGRKVLNEKYSSAKLTELQCSISAPWSYTVTKTINYTQTEPFTITKQLIEELGSTMSDELKSELKQDERLEALGLKIITKSMMNLSANGYMMTNPEGEKAKALSLSQANVVAQQYLIDAIRELQDKLFPRSKVSSISLILLMHTVTQELLNQANDMCLVDITYEATEIGVVRDKVLSYCTHIPFGSFSLAREISNVTGVPLPEAFGYLNNETPYSFLEFLTDDQKKNVMEVFEAYTERLSGLFKETGDALSIPKHISIHTNIKSESLFSDLVNNAALRNLRSEPVITPISKMIIDKTYKNQTAEADKVIPEDTTMLLSAQFFHTQGQRGNFEYLITDIL